MAKPIQYGKVKQKQKQKQKHPPQKKKKSWLQSPSAVILEPKKIKSDTVSPSISHEVMEPDYMILLF